MAKLKYEKVLLKLSGEVFKGGLESGIDGDLLMDFAKRIKVLVKEGVKLGIVIGGGNLWRFRDYKHLKLDRVTSDTMGMMATVMNALALESALKEVKVDVRAMSSFPCERAMENYVPKRARHHFEKGRVVICAGGTGSPYFTTDSAAALRALELDCDVLFKATKVNGVYDKDPMKFKNAEKYEKLSYRDVIAQNLKVMDLTCASLCMEKPLPILVFDINEKNILLRAVKGQKVGTIIS
ncbi:UMP kinase [Patescibacteria group bacterium]|nr:UMP kinase [Patescibacteria group bacterium]